MIFVLKMKTKVFKVIHNMVDLGNRLKYLREVVFRMSQEEFSKELNTSQMSLSLWERGDRNPKGQNIDRIIEFCLKRGVEINKEWLSTGEGDMLIKTLEPVIKTMGDVKLFSEDYWKEKTKHLEDKIRLQEELIAELKKRK